MLYNADAMVLLPGGMGSLDELFEAITWRQLGLHNKPIVVLKPTAIGSPARLGGTCGQRGLCRGRSC